jgi:hypothetical protein
VTNIIVAEVMDKHFLGWKDLRGRGQKDRQTGRQPESLKAFVTDGKVLGWNCDGRTELGTENLAEDGKSRHTH